MKRLLTLLIMLLCLFAPELRAGQLNKVSRHDAKDLVQIYFSFDKLPAYKLLDNGRRIDLVFTASSQAANLSFFPPDKEIVKILPRFDKDDLILSFFFRYRPQSCTLTKSDDDKLVFEILLGSENTKAFHDLAEKLKGIGQIDKISNDITNPTLQSPYSKDWMSFFSSYEPPVVINVPVKFTPPPFPIVRFLPPGLEENIKILPQESFDLYGKGLIGQLSDLLMESLQHAKDLEEKKILALSYGEVETLKGDFESAYKQLYLITEEYPEELIGTYASYLLTFLKAKYQDPNFAEYDYQILEEKLGKNTPLAPYLYLSQVEAALASGKLRRMEQLLNRDIVALPADILEIIKIRRADYWYATKNLIKAYASYHLLEGSKLLTAMPYSLNGLCSSLYDQKKFKEASSCYEQLAPVVTDKALVGIINFRKNMARLKYEKNASLITEFTQIENIYTGMESGFRAALKQTDLRYLQDKNNGRRYLEKYEEIADSTELRDIRAEALFKQAVIYSQLGERAKSIALLEQFLREFQVSDIRISAQALLIDILPLEIKRLVDKKDYVAALVLAKKHKDLFQNSWISGKFLVDIAEAYHRVGLFEEAQKLYLYLIEVMPIDIRQQFYLPMIQATFEQGAYSLVEDYSAQYFYNYPDGQQKEEILVFRLRALAAEERLTEAMHLLPSPLPENQDLYTIAGYLYFRNDDYEKCLDILKKLEKLVNPLQVKEQFMKAESLYQTNNFEEAESAFLLIGEDNIYYDQATFRLASLARKKGNEEKALSLFRKIVEKGKSPLWKKYAERELQFSSITPKRR